MSLNQEDRAGNLKLAFETGEKVGIPAFLEVEDMLELEVPDKASVITYLSKIYQLYGDKDPIFRPPPNLFKVRMTRSESI